MNEVEADAIARAAAARLAAEMCPGLPAAVARIVAARGEPGTGDPADSADLASMVVVASRLGCDLLAELRARTDRPAAGYLERRLRREMGIDEGMSDDLDRMVEAVVAALFDGLAQISGLPSSSGSTGSGSVPTGG
ncbi:MAG: hypothetical protein ACFCUO_10590 [Rhodospirillales bacterium]